MSPEVYQPLVSVVTPCYNSSRFLEETIRSVLTQDYERLEYIVVDGGSTDGTIRIIERYGSTIRWVSEPDHGQSEALNKGFRMATGEILGWLNADDVYLPGAVKRAVTFLREHPDTAAVYSDGLIIDADGRFLGQWRGCDFSLRELLLGRCFICQPTIFMRRDAVEEVGWLDESLHYTMDYDLWLRLGLRTRLGYLPERGAAFRLHPFSKTCTQATAFHGERLRVLDKVFGDPSAAAEVADLKSEAYGRAHLLAACHLYHLNVLDAAQKELCIAAQLAPQIVNDPEVFLPLVIGSLPANASPVPLVRIMFSNLPPSLAHLGRLYERAETWAVVASAFTAYERGDYRLARRLVWKALRRDWSWLENRGVTSMALGATFGPRLVKGIHVLRRLFVRKSLP